MAKYWITPDPAEVGTYPSGFTPIWDATTSQLSVALNDDVGEYVWRMNAGSGRSPHHITTIPPATDVEIFVDFYPRGNLGTTSGPRARMLMRGSTTAETGYTHGYSDTNSGNRLNFVSYVNGSYSSLRDGSLLTSGPRMYQRVGVSGSLSYGSAWPSTDPEPTEWQEEATNTDVTSAGVVGLGGFAPNSFDVCAIGVGTDGDPAPTGPLGTTEAFTLRHNPRTNKVIPVLTSPTVTDIGATCVRPRVTKGF